MLENPFSELGIKNEVVEAAITTMCKESLKDSGLDNKSIMRTKICLPLDWCAGFSIVT